MNVANTLDLIGAIVAFLLTIMVFSYMLGDNALFRIAAYILVGAAAGYATVLVVYNILWQRVAVPFINSPGNSLGTVVPGALLGLWLLLKASPRLSRLGSPAVALLVGVAAATVIGGAVQGTLYPQTNAAMNALSPGPASGSGPSLAFGLVNGLIVLVGTVTTLAYFHFGSRGNPGQASPLQEFLTSIGQVGKAFIAIALGVVFAGVYAAALSAFVGRMSFLWDFLWDMIERFFPIA